MSRGGDEKKRPAPQKGVAAAFLPVGVFFLLVFLLATYKVFNLDIWWHLETGEHIVSSLSIPAYDFFSHTASGTPWVPTQWLFQVVAYVIHHLFGFQGLILIKALLAAVTMGILYAMARAWGVSTWLTVSSLIAFAVVARFRFFLRPDMLSFFFLAMTLLLLERWRREGDRRSFYLLPLIMVVWANTHSGVTLGLVVLLLFFLSDLIGRLLGNGGGTSPAGFRATALLSALSMGVTLINPGGMDLYLFALGHYDIYKQIGLAESAPPLLREFPLYFILLAAVWLFQLSNMRRSSLFHLLLLLFFTHLSLKTARMIAWWAVAVAPLATLNLHQVLTAALLRYPALRIGSSHGTKALLSITFMALLFYLEVFLLGGYHHRIEFGLGVKEDLYPVGAVDFVLKNDLQGNMYNDQDFGGYILWRTYPERKVFNDPRMQVYYKLFSEFNDWKGLLNRYNISYALLEYPDTFEFREPPFTEEEWALVYWDDVAMVYVKRDEKNSDVIGRYEYRYVTRPYDELFLSAGKRLNEPAFVHGIRRELEARADRASYRSKLLSAGLAYRQGELSAAVTLLEKAVAERPEKQNACYHLGRILVRAGRVREGVSHLKRCRAMAPDARYGRLAFAELTRAGYGKK